MTERDAIDDVIEQWHTERPDLALAPMAIFGRLARIVALAGRAIDARFGAHDLQTGEFDVLAALRRAGSPHTLTPTALARTLLLSPAGMTNRLDRLEAAGLIERRLDPDDRRSLLVELTSAGRRLVDRAVTDHVANEAELLSALSGSEQRTLDTLLRKLLSSLEPPRG